MHPATLPGLSKAVFQSMMAAVDENVFGEGGRRE